VRVFHMYVRDANMHRVISRITESDVFLCGIITTAVRGRYQMVTGSQPAGPWKSHEGAVDVIEYTPLI